MEVCGIIIFAELPKSPSIAALVLVIEQLTQLGGFDVCTVVLPPASAKKPGGRSPELLSSPLEQALNERTAEAQEKIKTLLVYIKPINLI